MKGFLAVLAVLAICANGRIIKGKVVNITVGDTYFDVTSYGAVGDGKTDDTAAIQKAFAAAKAASGGTVRLPSGKTYLSKALTFQSSNTALEIVSGATLLVSNNRTSWPNNTEVITIKSLKNVAIIGGGVIEGQGLVWWQNRYQFRPKLVLCSSVKNIVISGVTFQNCPNHCLQMGADNTEIYGITIYNPPSSGIATASQSHNTDGIDVHGTPFYIHDSHIDTGDDNVACHENDTLVEDCYFGHGHGASIGSLSAVWLKNITFNRITFYNTTTGPRIKTIPGYAGELKNVTFSNMVMHGVGTTLEIDMFYTIGSTKPLNQKTTFSIHHITYKNITAYGSSSAGEMLCDGNSWCKNIVMKDVRHIPVGSLAYSCANITGSHSGTNSPTPCV